MNKVKDEMRPEYKCSDFKSLERGKFYAEAVKGTAVALLTPAMAKAVPTSDAVNEALQALANVKRANSANNKICESCAA